MSVAGKIAVPWWDEVVGMRSARYVEREDRKLEQHNAKA